MKALLISVNPKQAAKILNGEQTVIIKKTMPKCALPIDVYVYCTKWLKEGILVKNSSLRSIGFVKGNAPKKDNLERLSHIRTLNGKVVVKLRIREIDKIRHDPWGESFFTEKDDYRTNVLPKACIGYDELKRYLYENEFSSGRCYAYHVSDLQIFDEPKELSDLRYWGCLDKVKQAPRTFTYVEGLESL